MSTSSDSIGRRTSADDVQTQEAFREMVFVTLSEQIDDTSIPTSNDNISDNNNSSNNSDTIGSARGDDASADDAENSLLVDKFCRALDALSLQPQLVRESTTLAVHRENPLISKVFNLFSSARNKRQRKRCATASHGTIAVAQASAVQSDASDLPAAWRSFQLQHIHALVSLRCRLVRQALVDGWLELDATNLYFVVNQRSLNAHIVDRARLVYRLAAVERAEVRPLSENSVLQHSDDDAGALALRVSLRDGADVWFVVDEPATLPVLHEQIENAVHTLKASSVELRRARSATDVERRQPSSSAAAAAAAAAASSSTQSFLHSIASDNLPMLQSDTSLLDMSAMRQLYMFLPRALRTSVVELRYKMSIDGASRHTVLAKQSGGPQLLVLQDGDGNVFGAFLSHAWSTQERAFYGGGTTFLFGLRPNFNAYEWTRANHYFLLCDDEQCAVGGDESGCFGLQFDADLQHGTTQRCATFGNRALTTCTDDHRTSFEIVELEIYGFAD
jgi:hypothetical protein